MHEPKTAIRTLEFLWSNYQQAIELVDQEVMSPDEQAARSHCIHDDDIRSWLVRTSFIVSAWSLWEYHVTKLRERLPQRISKRRKTEFKTIKAALYANSIQLVDDRNLEAIYTLRNLIVHNAARVDDAKSKDRFNRLIECNEFRDLTKRTDGYIDLFHEHAAEVKYRIGCSISELARHWPNPMQSPSHPQPQPDAG